MTFLIVAVALSLGRTTVRAQSAGDGPVLKAFGVEPTVEFAVSTPTAHADEGTWGTTGTIQPGVVYIADKWQLAVEAVIPVNGASGHGAGVVASLDLFLDDIFPNTIGKPIFSQTLPMFTGARQ